MRRAALPAAAIVLALLVAAPAQAIEIPPEPAPVLFVAQNSGIHFTSPATEGDAATVGASSTAVSGLVGHPLATRVRVTIAQVFSSGMRGAAFSVSARVVRGRGTLLSQSSFGPVFVTGLPLNGTADYVVHVDTFRGDTPLGSLERALRIRRVPPAATLHVF